MLSPNQLLVQQVPLKPLLSEHYLPMTFSSLPSPDNSRLFQSNYDPPPNMFVYFDKDPLQPPPDDMDPSDLNLVPYQQKPRSDEDLYTPVWVRGYGDERQGWCGLCSPGRWLNLKRSSYWYDKTFNHGVNSKTQKPFPEPQETRCLDIQCNIWVGLCGNCKVWITLSSKRRTRTWFKHSHEASITPKNDATLC